MSFLSCRTSVEIKDGAGEFLRFEACGKPTFASVLVGGVLCHYCLEHAAAARRFVESQGNEAIAEIQRRMRVTP
jgi:hypothetical protein